ncbi:MAG TPA: biopolymer transporter ExbD [Candidatus Angelobacter sp.]|nr:biopolymer transporter ExbD [Candidatus Angelobacter sp.]
MNHRAAQETGKVNSSINVTPMVDVMLVLLIIFMVVTPMIVHGRPVEMAQAVNPEAMPDVNREDSLIVALTHDGNVFLGNELVQPEALSQKVMDRLASRREEKIVYVRADARVKYRFLADVVDELRSAGVDQVGLLTEQGHRRRENMRPRT